MFRLKRQKDVSIDVIDFSSLHVSTGQIGEYILNLYRDEGFSHIGYRANGGNRFIIYTLKGNNQVIQYFEDRCPGMIEEECKKLKGDIPYEFAEWPNSNFFEVKKKY